MFIPDTVAEMSCIQTLVEDVGYSETASPIIQILIGTSARHITPKSTLVHGAIICQSNEPG